MSPLEPKKQRFPDLSMSRGHAY